MGIMRGPMSMNVNDEIGLLISGFDTPPAVMLLTIRRITRPRYYLRI